MAQGLAFALLIALVSYRARFLTLGGAAAQFVLGFVLLGVGGWQWTVPMAVFFVLSSLLSKTKKEHRSSIELLFAKSSRRDAWQVFANGGVAGIIVLADRMFPSSSWYIAYLGSVAAATADTWGTEIGTHSRSAPRLILSLQPTEVGRSGGVTLLGTAMGFVGAIVIYLTGVPWLEPSYHQLAIAVALGGMTGSLIDSLLGASVQIQFKCARCGKLTERSEHCGVRANRWSGWAHVTNDVVNLACTTFGAIVAFGCSKF
jgi:uncharacterized protein (TIGR00297 family)